MVAAETDSATLAGFQGVVHRAFWWSILPAILVSLVFSYVLACMFVDPMDVFRAVGESVKGQRSQGADILGLWDSLTPREKEVAELVRQGLTNQEIAGRLTLSVSTINTHMKNVSKKTGLGKVGLAVAAQARKGDIGRKLTPRLPKGRFLTTLSDQIGWQYPYLRRSPP